MAELSCYTLISSDEEREIPNEQQLKLDLGNYLLHGVTP